MDSNLARETLAYEKQQVGKITQLTLVAASYISRGKLTEAIKLLHKAMRESEHDPDHYFHQEVTFQLAIIYLRLNQFEQAHKYLDSLLLLPNDGDQRRTLIQIRALTTKVILFIQQQESEKAMQITVELLRPKITSIAPTLVAQVLKQITIKLIGLQSMEDGTLITHIQPTCPQQFILCAIYKYVSGELDQCVYHLVKASQERANQNRNKESLMLLSLVVYIQQSQGKDTTVYRKKIEKIQKKIGIKIDISSYVNRISLIKQIISELNKQKDKLENLGSVLKTHSKYHKNQMSALKDSRRQMKPKHESIEGIRIAVYLKTKKALSELPEGSARVSEIKQLLAELQKPALCSEILNVLIRDKFVESAYVQLMGHLNYMCKNLENIAKRPSFHEIYMRSQGQPIKQLKESKYNPANDISD